VASYIGDIPANVSLAINLLDQSEGYLQAKQIFRNNSRILCQLTNGALF
jgi:hypothetical protein